MLGCMVRSAGVDGEAGNFIEADMSLGVEITIAPRLLGLLSIRDV